jgi:sensor histidine kinase regulating citrate/malate metabolism
MDLPAVLKEAGPYTAPLCTAMAIVIKWLLADRLLMLNALTESVQRERAIAEKRTEEALESARLLADSDRTQRDVLANHNKSIEKLVERIERWTSGRG